MKLSGNSRGGKHMRKNGYSGDSVSVRGVEASADKTAPSGKKGHPAAKKAKKRTGAQRAVRFVSIFLLVIAALSAGVMAWLKASVKPPDVITDGLNTPTGLGQPGDEDPGDEPKIDNEDTLDGESGKIIVRDQMKFTFVILGTDDGNGLTDTIMVAMFDASTYKLNVMNIPRDTLANVNGRGRKINEMYGASKGATQEEKMEAFKANLADVIGFKVNFYAIVDLDAFKKLVDGIGGVDFYVPVNMKYNDPYQNLSINISKGQQHLNGTEALKVVRFRNSYAQGDIKRISVQQDFLLEAAKQVIEKKNSLKINTLADIFLSDVKTDLTLGNLIWFAREMLKMDAENITFTTIPADYFTYDYVIINNVNKLLEYINENLNPFNTDITSKNVHILTSPPGGGSSSKPNTSGNNSQGNNSQGNSTQGNNTQGNNSQGNNNQGGSNEPGTTTNPGEVVTGQPPDDEPSVSPTETGSPPETEPPVSSEPPVEVEPSDEPPPTSNVVIPEG